MEVLFGKDAIIKNAENFDLAQIFECGQQFRFTRDSEYKSGVRYTGVAFGKFLAVRSCGNDIIFENTAKSDFENIWYPYFDLDRDYGAIIASIGDAHAAECARLGSGIRILKQEPWEVICSFIISQNNNIPRIRKIIETISQRFGEKFVACDGKAYFAFPSAEALKNAGEAAIFDCRTGFRAKYIYDAACKVCSGEFDIEHAKTLSADELCAELMKIKGVGPKVAACTGLFGFSHCESFPIDVWIKRVINKYYGDSFDVSVFGENAGIIQQYLFHYERNILENDK